MSYKIRTNCVSQPGKTGRDTVAMTGMAECLRPTTLAQLLECQRSKSEIILIDCRPSLTSNNGLILGSHQVHCPPIVKRRSGGNIPLDNILRDVPTRTRVVEGMYSHIVIFDERTTCLADLAKDSNMYLVIKTLAEEKAIKRIFFLHGGFHQFHVHHPYLCSSPSIATDPNTAPPILSLMGNVTKETKLYGAKHINDRKPAEVLPWLYIGSLEHARQADDLLELGMSALINMAASTESSPLPSPHFVYKNIPVRDSVTADIIQWFPEVICFIEKVRHAGGKVLVHCQAGISRSATICMAYLMYHKNLSLEDAFDYLKAKRSVISPNLNFMRQLGEFESKLHLRNLPLNGEASPTLALSILQEKLTPTKSNMALPIVSCMHHSPFAFDMPFMSQPATTSSPIMPLASPLMSPS